MSRGISAINEAQVNTSHVHDVTLVKLDFDTPVYVHSGVGTIVYGGAADASGGNEYKADKGAVQSLDKGAVQPAYVSPGDEYLGVGAYGGISAARESEALGPTPISLTLSGVDSDYISEALDSGNLYDVVTIYQGLRQDDGTLYDDPWILWKGWYEFASISVAEESGVSITCQHDLSQLSEKNGGRYTNEDQDSRYSGDVGLAFVVDMVGLKLLWGGGPVPVQYGTVIDGGTDGGEDQPPVRPH